MSHRVYWRVARADPLRRGGPWWYRDFKDWQTVWRFVMDHAGHFEEVRVISLERLPPHRSSLNIVPPEDAEVWLDPTIHPK
jgi:hypothetical protein